MAATPLDPGSSAKISACPSSPHRISLTVLQLPPADGAPAMPTPAASAISGPLLPQCARFTESLRVLRPITNASVCACSLQMPPALALHLSKFPACNKTCIQLAGTAQDMRTCMLERAANEHSDGSVPAVQHELHERCRCRGFHTQRCGRQAERKLQHAVLLRVPCLRRCSSIGGRPLPDQQRRSRIVPSTCQDPQHAAAKHTSWRA
jgi:hypothetical protein